MKSLYLKKTCAVTPCLSIKYINLAVLRLQLNIDPIYESFNSSHKQIRQFYFFYLTNH